MKILFLLPYFDETANSFSKLLVPILIELEKKDIPFAIHSANRNYKGIYQKNHKTTLIEEGRLAFLSFPINLLLGSLQAFRWKRRNPNGIVHNVGGGSSLIHDLITAHACHAQYLAVKRAYDETLRIALNPIHSMILITEWLNYRRRPRVIAISEYLEKGLLTHHPSLEGCINVIENAAPPTSIRWQGSSATEFQILYASNNHHRKGLIFLLEAMEKAKTEGLSWELRIAGKDPFESNWMKRVESMGLSESVHFLGHRTDLQDLMSQSDIFCFPSKYESFGMVLLEAAQIGCPVYGTDTGIMRTLYRPESGPELLAHPAKSELLFQGLKFWSQHPRELSLLGKIGYDHTLGYDAEVMAQRTIELYRLIEEKSL